MLTLAQCRALLGPDAPESDSDVETLRDCLYGAIEAALDSLIAAPREGAEQEAS